MSLKKCHLKLVLVARKVLGKNNPLKTHPCCSTGTLINILKNCILIVEKALPLKNLKILEKMSLKSKVIFIEDLLKSVL